ncbi:MAG: hypothetical protein CVT48_03865 [Thermoplasmata archaeon HGW-Thermoplasmata-1]|nr:MAG: hypothetical protein CVT48_03865 [Thermoplasmata archaeon HGW-Thermoplasmata-1]
MKILRKMIARAEKRCSKRGESLGRIAIWSSRNAKMVMASILVITVLLGIGMGFIDTNVDVTDVLPRGDPNTEAAKNVTASFKSAYTQQGSVMLLTNPDAWEVDNQKLIYRNPATIQQYDLGPNNVTDEVYVRAAEEFFGFVAKASGGVVKSEVSVPGFYKIINWAVEGGKNAPDEAACIPDYKTPDGAARYDLVHRVVRATVGDTLVDAVIDPSYDQQVLMFMVDPDEKLSSKEIGEIFMSARDAYIAAAEGGELEWSVFGPGNPPILIADSPVANAHASELTKSDITYLAPLVLGFLFIILLVAFRNIRSVVISGTTLLIGVVWTYGIMGYAGIPLNTLNLTIVPLIMGVGIDYTIHMMNEFIEHKAEGCSDHEAFRLAGNRAGLAMYIATLTTVMGLVVMIFSPSLLMAQLGFLSALAIVFIYFLTLVFIPAALSLVGNTERMGKAFRPSRLMPAWGAAISRRRGVCAVLIVLISVFALFSAANIGIETFGDPGSNFPESDSIRQEHEAGLIGFYDSPEPEFKTNILVFQGDVTDYDTHLYIREIENNLAAKPSVNSDTLRNFVIAMESWMMIKDGGASVAPYTAQGELYSLSGDNTFNSYPQTKAEIESEIEAMFSTPYRQPASMFMNYPENGITSMTFAVTSKDFEDAKAAWGDVWDAVEEAEPMKPDDVSVAFVGNTATNYLFIQKELPWLTYMSIVASLAAVLIVGYSTRDVRATATVGLLTVLTTVWFLGVLPLLGIGLAITLVLPMVFIFNIGTDYAVHLIWNIKQVGDARKVFANVGKAIFFSALTTIGAFALFTRVQNVAMQKTMLATAVAIGVIFFATIVVVALTYRVDGAGRQCCDN